MFQHNSTVGQEETESLEEVEGEEVEVRGSTEEGMENTEGVIDPEAIEGKNFISKNIITLI